MRFSKSIAASLAGLVLAAGLGGCAAQRSEVIPSTARLVNSGSGEKMYTAPSDGMMYVYDQPGDRLIWSGQVRTGQIVGVNPGRNEVTLNGAPVSSRAQVGNGRVDILFDPSLTASAQPVGVTTERSRSATVTPADGAATVTAPGSFTVQPPPVTVTPSVKVEQQPVPANSVVTPAPSADPGK